MLCDCQEGPVPRPSPCKALDPCKPSKITLRTKTIPANLGTDAEGQPYAPALGSAYNTIVFYLANGAVYIYDSNGVYTEVEPGGFAELVQTVESFKQALNELYDPAKIGYMVKTHEQLEALSPTVVPADQFVLVTEDETHNGRPSLYSYDPAVAAFVYAYAASPYYEKPFIDSVVVALQTNINNVMNKETEDVNNLQININAAIARIEALEAEIATLKNA